MNYKREKLNKTNSIPTIYISPDANTEVDLMKNPTEWVDANRKKEVPSTFQKSSKIDMDESQLSNVPLVSDDIKLEMHLGKKRKIEIVPNTAVRILNKNVASGNILLKPVIEPSSYTPRVVKKLPTVSETHRNTKIIKVAGENYTIISKSQSPKIIKQEIVSAAVDMAMGDQQCAIALDIDNSAIIEPQAQVSTNLEGASEDLKPILQQISEIKEMLSKSQHEVPASNLRKSDEDNSNISQSHLNKVQLFNGIKRYISPSLNALLRMELFSAPGREYKKDERIICQELLSLGERTYDFLTEEWRLRLPVKVDVQRWISEQISEEEDDAS